MTIQNLEAVARRGVGLPNVFREIRKNRTTLRNMLRLFQDLFKLSGGNVSLVTANVPAAVEVVQTREERLDRLLRESQARRDAAGAAREARQRDRLAGLRGAYGARPS